MHAPRTYIADPWLALPILRYTRDTCQIASGDNHESPKPHRPSIVFIHIRNSQPQPTCSLQGIGHTTHTRAILRCCACCGHDESPVGCGCVLLLLPPPVSHDPPPRAGGRAGRRCVAYPLLACRIRTPSCAPGRASPIILQPGVDSPRASSPASRRFQLAKRTSRVPCDAPPCSARNCSRSVTAAYLAHCRPRVEPIA